MDDVDRGAYRAKARELADRIEELEDRVEYYKGLAKDRVVMIHQRNEELARLKAAAKKIYLSAFWHPDRKTEGDTCRMWRELRDALGLDKGTATRRLGEARPPMPTPTSSHRDSLIIKATNALESAYAKHGRRKWTRHEFYGILLEEVEELWDSIKADEHIDLTIQEMVQVMAVCMRFWDGLIQTEEG